MATPNDPNAKPSSAKNAAAASASDSSLPKEAKTGSTGSHYPASASALPGSGVTRTSSTESDIAQFLAHSKGQLGANTDDAPTVITQNAARPPITPPPVPQAVSASEPPPSIMGRTLGQYELIEAIGAGGMAAVLKARDLELGRVVALKILPPESARDPESITRFKQEARAAAKLDHENIARVYSCGEDQGLHFIAFEFVEGDNLRVVIDRRGRPLSASESVRYMIQVAAGLAHANERGVVHRDIKPSNILITPDGRAKIVDMGLARHLSGESVNGGVTQSGVTLGTFDYISPEQALDPRRADVRSDIYSLGCTFYHALTGRPPVPEGTAARKLRAHQEDDFLDPRELNRAIPDELAAILARMMMKDPVKRFQTPTELISHLKGLAEKLNVQDALAHDSNAQAVPAPARALLEAPQLRPWWIVGVVAVSLAIVAFVIATSEPGRAPGLQGNTDNTNKDKNSDTVKGVTPVPNVNPPAPVVVRTAEQLAQALEDPATTKITLAAGTFDLSKLAHTIAFRGTKLELVGAGSEQTRIVLFADAARGSNGSLSLKSDTLTIRGIWFDLHDRDAVPPAIPGQPVGVRIEDANDVELIDCVFAPSEELRMRHESRAVLFSRTAETPAQFSIARCVFLPGTVGLQLPAMAKLNIADSGFAPHHAAILLDAHAGETVANAEVRFEHTSFMLDAGNAAIETGAPAHLQLSSLDCVYAPIHARSALRTPFASLDLTRHGVVVRVRGEKPDGVQFQTRGRANAFYNVDAIATTRDILTFEECKTAKLPIELQTRVELKQRPWGEIDPVTLVTSERPWRAFGLAVKTDPALFTNDKSQRPEPLGVAFYDANNTAAPRRAYPELSLWPPNRPVLASEVKQKVWFPAGKDTELAPGVFTDLRTLLKAARPDDVILIRHNGELKIDSEELKAATKPSDGEFRVTFRPAPGMKPVLTLNDDDERDQTLFKLKSGEVTFDGIHFVLKPNRPKDAQIVAAVAVIGGKSCTFRNCAFTIAEEDDSKVAVVHLPDIDKVMAMDTMNRPAPKVVFDHCVIRGRGRAVWVEVTRPLNLEMNETLTAIDGPLLLTEAGGKANNTNPSTAKFTRLTALAGGPIVEMHGGKSADAARPAGLVKLEVESDECLFLAVPGAGRPLLELTNVEPTELKSVLAWQVKKANRYANFDSDAVVASIRPPTEGTAKDWNWDDWVANVGEPASATGKRLGKVTLAAPPMSLKELQNVKPSDVAIKMFDFADITGTKITDAGADSKSLPPLANPDE